MEHNLQRTWYTDNKRVHNNNIDSTCKCLQICSAGTEKKDVSSWEAFLSWKQSEQDASHTCFIQPKDETKYQKELGIAI